MQYHQGIQERTRQTVAVIREFCPALQVSLISAEGLAERAEALDGLAQARDAGEAAAQMAEKAEAGAYAQMRDFTLRVSRLIEGHFPDAHPLRESLQAVYAIVPESRAAILRRADVLLPIWRQADEALAERHPAEGPVMCDGKGAADAAALRSGIGKLGQATAATHAPLALARAALRTAARAVDKLNKRFYKKLQAESRDNAALCEGMKQIPAERAHRRPKPPAAGRKSAVSRNSFDAKSLEK
jgi:hypothetical protein